MFKFLKDRKKKDNKGFTLVELVIVVAILAILVGILAPQYTKYVEKSRKAADVSNLDNLVTAFKTAASDGEDKILYLVSGGGAIGGGDIKLMFACGLILGWKLILLAFVLGCIIGSVVHIIRMVRKKAGRMLAMGPYLSAGILLAALWGNRWISWYLSLIFN